MEAPARRSYSKPVLRKLETGLMNKFGQSPAYARRVRSEIDGVKISELVERFGSPLFVYSERTLREKYRRVKSAFANRYPNVTLGWSYKTNYLRAICAMLHQEGAVAELVSKMEFEMARSLGVPADDMILNGPLKPPATLEAVLGGGGSVNVDHLDEILDLEKVAGKLGRTLKVGMRLNMDTGIYPQWSRFGFNLESGQALEAAKRMARGKRLALDTLHAHLGTFIMDPGAYGRQVEKMVAFGYKLQEELEFRIDTLDIGGGFPSHIQLKGTYLSPDVGLAPVDDYAERVTDALWRTLEPGHFPRLVLEAGRAIVDEAGSLITTVWASKRLPDGTRAYVVDAGINLLFTSLWYKFDVAPDRPVSGPNEPCVIYGPMCMNIDCIEENGMLPPLSRGTRLVVSPVGAYNNTQWMQFIEYRPNVVLVGEGGQVEVIREAERLEDLHSKERLPPRLARKAGGTSAKQPPS